MSEREAKTGARARIEGDATNHLDVSFSDRDADVYLSRPRNTPLSVDGTHAMLKVATEDAVVDVELNGEELDAVVDALTNIQQYHREGRPE